jgi:hypothetical protein
VVGAARGAPHDALEQVRRRERPAWRRRTGRACAPRCPASSAR